MLHRVGPPLHQNREPRSGTRIRNPKITINDSINFPHLYSTFSSYYDPKHSTACYIVTINCKT